MKNNNSERLALTLLVLFLAIVVYVMFKAQPPQELFPHAHNAAHVLAFFVMSVTAWFAFPSIALKTPVWFWGFFVLLAPLLEYFQGVFRPLRISSADDVVANLAGVFIAWIVMWLGRAGRSEEE